MIQFGELRLYEVPDLCAKLKLSERTVRQLISSGTLEGKKLAKKWYVTEESLKNYFNKEALPGLEATPYFICATFAWLLSKGSQEVTVQPDEWCRAVYQPGDNELGEEAYFVDLFLGLLEKLRDKEIIVDYRLDERTSNLSVALNPRFIRPFFGETWWNEAGVELSRKWGS